MFKKMEYVYEVYKEKSFTRAAEKLFISQPCLSAAIKKIEEKIGMPIFERRYSSVRPTKIGEEYIKAVEKMMSIEKDFDSKINDINQIQYGHITVGGSNYVSSYILPLVAAKFAEIYPKIEITLMEAGSTELERMLNNEELDLMIDSFDTEDVLHESYPIIDEKILLAVPSGSNSNIGLEKYQIKPHDIYTGKVDIDKVPGISVENFKEEKFILLKSGHNMHKYAMRVFKNRNFTPQIAFKLDQLSTSYRFTALG
ncbi:MAG: LysR family transcriptional regulator, partial [Clostridia bacterium]|nr:LysR family transcriptional regulator [Clostridia bacterium]